MHDLLGEQGAIGIVAVAADPDDPGDVREVDTGSIGGPQGPPDDPAVAVIDLDVVRLARAAGLDGAVGGALQARLVPLDQEGDRLRRFRALLPCEVVVTAVTHPLHGCRLRAYAFRHVDGVPHLKVELPDGLPGLVAVEAVDVPGSEQAVAGAGLILDGAGLRGLHAVVMRLRERDAPGGRR